MANKTINELSPVTLSSTSEFAVYQNGSTGKATLQNILGSEDFLYADDQEEPTGEVEFESADTTLTPSSSTSVDLLTGNDSWGQRFAKISQMFKNIRYLLGKLGTTDISTIGDGTITDAINTINTNINTVINLGDVKNLFTFDSTCVLTEHNDYCQGDVLVCGKLVIIRGFGFRLRQGLSSSTVTGYIAKIPEIIAPDHDRQCRATAITALDDNNTQTYARYIGVGKKANVTPTQYCIYINKPYNFPSSYTQAGGIYMFADIIYFRK